MYCKSHEEAGVDSSLVTDRTGLLVGLLVTGLTRLHLDHSISVGTTLVKCRQLGQPSESIWGWGGLSVPWEGHIQKRAAQDGRVRSKVHQRLRVGNILDSIQSYIFFAGGCVWVLSLCLSEVVSGFSGSIRW